MTSRVLVQSCAKGDEREQDLKHDNTAVLTKVSVDSEAAGAWGVSTKGSLAGHDRDLEFKREVATEPK